MRDKNYLYTLLALILILFSILILLYVLRGGKLANTNETSDNVFLLETQKKKVGDVEVLATPKLSSTAFEVSFVLDTHSVELNYDLTLLAVLTNEEGETLTPLKWKGDALGGHHRKGQLFFQPFPTMPKTLDLVINEIEGESVKFTWEVK
ncbi:hypothetical protein A2716_01165 [candidate division WWE3 bacterium RIFCSPHIGHO2_01_FULL_40_23]|uniref:DUF4352 domain-containing protein n=1 Tax=candidate division WWE3 bacterium RIFCSPLOWO2_01_FULL_41_18 TaxID=1802625 RepID=A0A1F4VDV5_UNCKA|nr:MAG: hypothetical protein A2716_01165 [candidate division WWE3 bacterium RIFCSPHIGHO2_01_FULL_40_23]OGC55347.1 MAG: hypothetical protein A3A78_00070 [candidate division WWE3 bacterium RIFCSPLOWO2_01_FULL_41_18]